MLKKLLKSNIFIYIVSVLLKIYVYLVVWTSKVDLRIDEKAYDLIKNKTVFFATCWHGRVFIVPLITRRWGRYAAVTSDHTDGQYIAEFIARFGHKSIRGSSRKKGFQAVKGITKLLNEGTSIAITPDGPKGPYHHINGNIDMLAYQYNMAILPMCFSSSRAKILSTWDKMLIPLPFGRIIFAIGAPIVFTEESRKNKKILADCMIEQEHNVDRAVGLKC